MIVREGSREGGGVEPAYTYVSHAHRLPGNSGTAGDGEAYRGSQAGQDITQRLLSAYSELGTGPRVSPAPSPMSLHVSWGGGSVISPPYREATKAQRSVLVLGHTAMKASV